MIRASLFIALATVVLASSLHADAAEAADAQAEVKQLRHELADLKLQVNQTLDELRELKTDQAVSPRHRVTDADRRAALERIESLLARQHRLDDQLDDLLDRQAELESDVPAHATSDARYTYRYADEPATRWAAPEPTVDTRPTTYTTRRINDAPTLASTYTRYTKTYAVDRPVVRTTGPAVYVGRTYRHSYRGWPNYGSYDYRHHRYYGRHHVGYAYPTVSWGYRYSRHHSGSYIHVNTGGFRLILR